MISQQPIESNGLLHDVCGKTDLVQEPSAESHAESYSLQTGRGLTCLLFQFVLMSYPWSSSLPHTLPQDTLCHLTSLPRGSPLCYTCYKALLGMEAAVEFNDYVEMNIGVMLLAFPGSAKANCAMQLHPCWQARSTWAP